MRITCTVNGEQQQADNVWEGESLLYVLRERLGFPGSKNACEQGECGSCTVYLDGVLACACLVAAGQAQDRDVRTVEGLAPGGELSTVQRAFLEAGAVQCGFCTPGLLVAARRRDPGGPGRQPVPVHRVREDHGGGPPGGSPAVWRRGVT
jgi:carbon-monoxide dehydrogenase small subunit